MIAFNCASLMQERCCAIGCFLNNSRKAHAHYLATLMILRNFISLRAFTVYMENSLRLKFHFGQFDGSEICTEVIFTTPELMWTLTMKLPHTEVKSQIGVSSLRVSYKRALRNSTRKTVTLPINLKRHASKQVLHGGNHGEISASESTGKYAKTVWLYNGIS